MRSLHVVLTAAAFFVLLTLDPEARHFSDWSEPVNLGPFINSEFGDASPAVSKNGRSLYFASNRPGQLGGNDIYVSERDKATGSWGFPVNLGPIVNTAATEFSPSLSRDGHWLFFHSNRTGSFVPGLDIWASYRQNKHDDFAWQPPVNVGPGVNAPGLDTGASFFENRRTGVPQLFFASNRGAGPSAIDIYVSTLQPDGTLGPAILVPELSSPEVEPGLSVRSDGLEVFLFSNRPMGHGGHDLWTATRRTVFDPWSVPTNLGPLVNGAANDEHPHIASDRQTLYFSSTRTGGFGGSDVYVTTRTRIKKTESEDNGKNKHKKWNE